MPQRGRLSRRWSKVRLRAAGSYPLPTHGGRSDIGFMAMGSRSIPGWRMIRSPAWTRHGVANSRFRCEGDGKGCEASGPRPDEVCGSTVSTRTNAPRGLRTRALGSRILNPLRQRPPAGGGNSDPVRTAWAISAHACCAPRPLTARVSSHVSGNLPGSVAKAVLEDPRPARPARPPLTAATVAGRAPFPCCQVGLSMGAVWARLINGGEKVSGR